MWDFLQGAGNLKYEAGERRWLVGDRRVVLLYVSEPSILFTVLSIGNVPLIEPSVLIRIKTW